MQKILFAVGGALAALLVVALAAPVSRYFSTRTNVAITSLGDRAFGSLANNATSGSGVALGMPAARSADLSTKETAVTPTIVDGGGANTSSLSLMPAPDSLITYSFVYKGDALTLPDKTLPVYKRVRQDQNAQALVEQLPGLKKLIDVDSFGAWQVQFASIAQEGDTGYMLSYDATQGSISLGQNGKGWYTADAAADGLPTVAQLPEAEVIALANTFLRDHGIAVDRYGAPQTQANDPVYTEMIRTKQAPAPESVSITFPLQIDDKPTYDESGNPVGLTVNLNQRLKKVSDVYNIETSTYEKSNYEAETDVTRILKFAEQGGRYGAYDYALEGVAVEKRTVELGTPSRAQVMIWQYDETNLTSTPLYAPALVFPVTGGTTQELSQQRIIVPLVKDLLIATETTTEGTTKTQPLTTPVAL